MTEPYLSQCLQENQDFPNGHIDVHTDRFRFEESHVILFNLQDLNFKDFSNRLDWYRANFPSAPKKRSPKQKWTLFWRETPAQLQIPEEKLVWMDNIFNWTVSYR